MSDRPWSSTRPKDVVPTVVRHGGREVYAAWCWRCQSDEHTQWDRLDEPTNYGWARASCSRCSRILDVDFQEAWAADEPSRLSARLRELEESRAREPVAFWSFWVAAAACALSLGCGQGHTYHVDDAFTADERDELVAAIADISTRTGVEPLELVFDGDISHGTQRIVKAPPPPDGTGRKLDGEFHWAAGDERAMYMSPELRPARFSRVARHELGHLYGMDHHSAPGLMDPDVSAEWDDADEAECRRVGMCGGSR